MVSVTYSSHTHGHDGATHELSTHRDWLISLGVTLSLCQYRRAMILHKTSSQDKYHLHLHISHSLKQASFWVV